MPHPLEFEIREHLFSYVAGEISLQEFEDWFFPKAWESDQLNDGALLDLIYQIKLDWSEYTDGDWPEEDLRRMWRSLAEKFTISSSPIRLIYDSSNNTLFGQQFTMRSDRYAGTKFVRVYG